MYIYRLCPLEQKTNNLPSRFDEYSLPVLFPRALNSAATRNNGNENAPEKTAIQPSQF